MLRATLLGLGLLLAVSTPAFAHFGMVIPSQSMVTEQKQGNISVDLSFSHPMEMNGMNMARPKTFQVVVDGKATDLVGKLTAKKIMDHDAWTTNFAIKRPGVYQFVAEPVPYWEPAEDCFIVHYTKTYVAAFGNEDGWDEPAGLPTEIVPLTRPFGNYAGNVFQGQVLLNGKPAPNSEVEVEYYNKDQKRSAPTDYMVTQVIKADAQGVFTFAVPFAGWWGFAALNTADEKMTFEGQPKDVELGAVIWMEFVDPALSLAR